MKHATKGKKMIDKIMLFAHLVSEINISKYEQKEYVQLVKAIYFEIFGENNVT